jgi:hypothetical protein
MDRRLFLVGGAFSVVGHHGSPALASRVKMRGEPVELVKST